jgi:hypothetical protein
MAMQQTAKHKASFSFNKVQHPEQDELMLKNIRTTRTGNFELLWFKILIATLFGFS